MATAFERIGDLARRVPAITPELLCGDIYRRLIQRPQEKAMAVVNADGVPVGLVSRLHFLTRYSQPYVCDLFDRKPIAALMQSDPVIVDAEMEVERVARIVAMERDDALAFGFVITRSGRYLGIGTGASLIRRKVEIMSRRQRDLKRAIVEAEQANRAKSEFLAMISHELRTPLNAVIGFSELMRNKVHGDLGNPRYASYAQDIHDAGNHLLSVINDILDLSKAEAGQLDLNEDEIEVAYAIEAVHHLMRERIKVGGVSLESVIPTPFPLLKADTRKFRQMLFNLISNSIKFTPMGGRIAIRASVSNTGGIDVTVADTGIGMAARDIPLALKPFGQIDSRLSRRFEGTGLGLPLVKAMIELHGGHLEIASSPGAGTTIRLIFPPSRTIRAGDISNLEPDPPPIAA